MIVFVRVSTNSDRPGVEKIGENEYKVRVHAKPVDGKANADVVESLAEFFDVPKSRVRIVAGLTSKRKTVEIDL